MKKTVIIEKAKILLNSNSLDAGHNLSHHERVRDLCFEILNNLPTDIREMVNMDTLEIAAMWHDVQADKVEMQRYLSESAILAISEHEFWDRPKTIEGKILYDADKLDALSIERGRQIVTAIRRREISESRKKLYIRVGKFWLKHMRDRLHFDYSKNLYDARLKEIVSNPELKILANKINIDMSIIQKATTAKPNMFERLVFKVLSIYYKFQY